VPPHVLSVFLPVVLTDSRYVICHANTIDGNRYWSQQRRKEQINAHQNF
jgi:hypothetical protein